MQEKMQKMMDKFKGGRSRGRGGSRRGGRGGRGRGGAGGKKRRRPQGGFDNKGGTSVNLFPVVDKLRPHFLCMCLYNYTRIFWVYWCNDKRANTGGQNAAPTVPAAPPMAVGPHFCG